MVQGEVGPVTEGVSAFGGEPEPSDSLRTFGAVVQGLREHAGLSREEFGERVRLSKHTIASIETGRRMPDPGFVERAEPVLGNTGALRRAIQHVQRRVGLASWFRQWARMEAAAVALSTYECRVVPGLLQTELYARALFEERLPPLRDEEIEAQLAARLERQRLLTSNPHTSFSFVVDEHVFRRTIGAESAAGLLEHALGMSARRNVELQVLPQSIATHPGLDGPMQLLETPDHHWFAYTEGQESGLLIADPKVVSILQHRYAKLRSQALSPQDSRSLLEQVRGEL